jgi:bacillithiol biosynthesis cysteine-adding enzyme BshC
MFAEYGLVIIDPDDKRLKTEFLEIIKDDIVNQTNFRIVSQSIEKLQSLNIKPQVNPREINVFHLNGDRKRIEDASDDVLALSPEQYSPNVVLRPLYQQLILPNLAYVGGPGEIAYWLEYKAMFDHHGILFPVLMPRNFALLADQKTVQQLDKLNLNFMDIFKEHDLLIREYIANISGSEISLNDQAKALKELYDSISEKAAAIDPTLKSSVEAELQKSLNALKNIESKILRSEKQKQEVSINQIKKISEKLFPENTLQERYENFAPYYLKYGKSFIKELKDTFDPFEFKLLIIELN